MIQDLKTDDTVKNLELLGCDHHDCFSSLCLEGGGMDVRNAELKTQGLQVCCQSLMSSTTTILQGSSTLRMVRSITEHID
jgi:hypothetical protein